MQLFDGRLMRLMTFLTRRQAWLSPQQISRDFRLDGREVSARTIHRWFSFLRQNSGFVYYPYPKASVLGLQDVLVRIEGLRRSEVMGILPFGASWGVSVGLGDGVPRMRQGYWVPGPAVSDFEEYWKNARDLELLDDFKVSRVRNTHFVFSPFEQVTRPDGVAELQRPIRNRYFEQLIRRNVSEPFRVGISDVISNSPLVVPTVLEHIWEHFSSRQVWRALRSRGDAELRPFFRGQHRKALSRPGVALQLIQRQWRELLGRFGDVFLQPRVFFDWPSLRHSMLVSIHTHCGSVDGLIRTALHVSQKALETSLRPEVGEEGRGIITSFAPEDQLVSILRIIEEAHRGNTLPELALQDREATLAGFDRRYCKVDWSLFAPDALEWRFDTDRYLQALDEIGTKKVALHG